MTWRALMAALGIDPTDDPDGYYFRHMVEEEGGPEEAAWEPLRVWLGVPPEER